ncbi:dimethyl sulfoxide reductase chain A [Proteus mirabilis]|uniref:Dimethyl sulfoxide reductase chain A n=1 Tax=Proteus mirabilis TaxID=584 RepID=A0A379GGA1_PROMI|nr:dimethyl sulfoxide reductase chain A [Proteus mirabilis]
MSKIKNNVSITEMSRRGFIQSAAVLSGAAAVAGTVSLPFSANAQTPRVFVLMRRLKPSNTVHA